MANASKGSMPIEKNKPICSLAIELSIFSFFIYLAHNHSKIMYLPRISMIIKNNVLPISPSLVKNIKCPNTNRYNNIINDVK